MASSGNESSQSMIDMRVVSCQQQQQLSILPISNPRNSNPFPLHPSILIPRLKSSPKLGSSTHQHYIVNICNNENRRGEAQEQQHDLFRKHNSKSAALLLSQHQEHHLQPLQDPDASQNPDQDDKMLQLSTLTSLSSSNRRIPQFPGSIKLAPDKTSPLPLFNQRDNDDGDIDSKILMRALEIRRNAIVDILKQLMRGSKFSITYSSNVISRLPDFIDHVMVTAASMKQLPEFSHSTFDARVKIVIQNSNVIPLIRWLKHNSLTYPQIGKLICMTPRDLGSIRGLIEWLKSIYVKGRFLGYVLTKASGVLKHRPEELEELVIYLENNGVRRVWMGFIVSRCPQLLSFSMEEMLSRVNFFLEMGINTKDFGTMVFDYPKALGFFSLEEMNNKVQYLKEFGLGSEDVGRLLAFKPQLIGCSIEEKWKPLVKYLYYLGVRRDGMRRILTLKPMIFCVDLETTIAPKVRFLQDIGIREEAIGGVLVKFPTLLTYSLYKKIRPVVIFLMTKAGVSQRDIGKVIALGPELLGCSIIDKLEVNVKYFLSLGITLQSLGEMIADFPMLLRYNLDVLRPKYRYLRRTMVRPLQDLIEFPRFFSYSLEGRIIPRHKVMVENQINFKLRYMLPGPDEEFNMRVEAAIERRRRFESGGMDDKTHYYQTNSFSERIQS
ncbi:transcription termination factor MTERF2, chloroplastic isoform X2 [Magnolia sinica]|uniref:transcription termination factor MTERF2, chloroplastic isoform X2 n=1 Tax=Magnolia sinica TaxID=86752 RepID=UPI002657E3D1|nr:transcription termination factor MTERF2, chloroplastic isoform X2 [Magnolia sinica]